MEKKYNREWVKTAAIIFLIILLLLTFFSNTIMNRTLPEVASTSVTGGPITAKVRGTGTVTAVGNNEVKANITRYIASVMVKEGQTVNTGDVLFVMGEGESDELKAAQDELDALEFQLMRNQNSYPTSSNTASGYAVNSAWQAYVEAQAAYDQALDDYMNHSASAEQIALAKSEMESAYSNLQVVKSIEEINQSNAFDAYELVYNNEHATEDEKRIALETYQAALRDSQGKISEAQFAYDAKCERYEALLDASSSEYKTKLEAAESKLRSAENSYYTALDSYNSSNASRNQASTSTYIDVLETQAKIEKAKAKIAELSGGAENQITARVSGTVTTINKSAGDKVQKDDILCVIEVPDMGYTMSCSVSNDQAKRLKIGDSATVSNYYWGSDIIATVSAIKTDPKDPQTKKLIVFDLKGNVTSGAELTVSVGQKSANYDLIVPNNAVRSDSNGSFVLVITSKNSALGNRYFAKRVDVTVLASDDTSSAVSGNLSNGDFVITTSSSPVSNGDQVRMADT